MNQPAFSFPQVALDFMNRDHADFALACGKILEALAALDHEMIDKLLDNLLQHTVDHFAAEERVMQESGFPPYPIHKGEHDRVLADMSDRLAQWRNGRDGAALQAWLEGPVAQWFTGHVTTMDFVTAQFAASRLQRT